MNERLLFEILKLPESNCNVLSHKDCFAENCFVSFKTSLLVNIILKFFAFNPSKIFFCDYFLKIPKYKLLDCNLLSHKDCFPEKSFVSFITYLLVDFKITCVAFNSLPHTIIQRYFSVSTF